MRIHLSSKNANLRGESRTLVTTKVSPTPEEASVADMIETYRASGQRIADLRTEEPDLEDVFLALTYQADAKQSA